MTKQTVIPDAALAQHIAVLGKTRSGKSSAMRGLVEGLLDREQPVCIIDPKGDWFGLKSSADGKHAGYPVVIFGGEHADVPINAHSGSHIAELVATGNRSCIIDLGGWEVGPRTRFFNEFASTLFRLARGTRHLVIDEVHNFCPKGKLFDPEAGKMLHWANRLASEGAGKGLLLIAASQRPQKVHNDFLNECETLIAMRLIHPMARAAIKDWIDGCPDAEKGREVLQSLASMPRGTGWVWSPEINFGPQRVAFPLFRTYDSFKPRTGDAPAKLKGWADVDLDDVRAKLETVVKEAEANDPRLLRQRIAELERDAKKGYAAPTIDPQAIDQAEQSGYMRGKIEGYREGLAAFPSGHLALTDRLLDDFSASVKAFRRDVEAWQARQPDAPAVPRRQQAPAPAPARAARRRQASGIGTTMPKAERLILTALAQYEQGRSKSQVAILTGYAGNGGGFNNAVSALRAAGRIEGSGDRLTITQAGLDALGPYEPLPHGDALLQHWMRQLGKAERAALEVLVQAYPKALSKDTVGERANYEPNGGGFNNAISRLRSLELITGRGELQASHDLFG